MIGGIPPNLTQLGTPPLDLTDKDKRDRFYQGILDDPAMQPTPDPSAPQRLPPACARGAATAEPSRRLVRLAQSFGESGLPTSICDEHWTSALTLLALPTEDRLDAVCVRQPVPRGADGRIPCKVYWELPALGHGPPSTPTECSALPFLTRVPGDHAKPPIAVTAVMLDCVDVQTPQDADAAAAAESACNVAGSPRLPGVNAESVGHRCMPAVVPDNGFDDRDVSIGTGAKDCGTGVCMAFHLAGDPQPSCATRIAASTQIPDPPSPPRLCSATDQVADHLYCSCRCRAPDPSLPGCTCPHGFACHEVLTQGGPAFEGGYCVKNGTYPDPGP